MTAHGLGDSAGFAWDHSRGCIQLVTGLTTQSGQLDLSLPLWSFTLKEVRLASSHDGGHESEH